MRTRTHFICIGMHFDYVCHLTITNIMEAAFGHLHKGGRAAFGGPPTFVETIMGDGVSNMFMFVYIGTD